MKGAASLMMRMKTTVAGSAAVAVASVLAATLACGATAAYAQAAQTPGGTPPAAEGLSEGVVAIVNDNIISSYDLSQRVALLIATTGVRPTAQNMPQLQQEALRGLIDERLEVDEIRREEKEQKFSIMADDDEVNDYIARIAQGSRMTTDQLLAALAGMGVAPDTLKDQIRAQRSWAHWIQGRYGGSRLKIGQDQINLSIQTIEAEAAKPQYNVGEIFIDASRAGGIDQATAGAQQLIAQMQQGAPFAAVARQFSSASTAANGGDAGWLTESAMPPEVRAAVLQMRAGQLSAPIVTRDGVYIVLLKDKRAGSDSTIVELKQAAISLPADAPDAAVSTAQAKLTALKGKITSCADVEPEAAKVEGVVAGDLGQTDVKDLAPAFQQAISGLKVGQVSDPVRTSAGLHLIALCDRHLSGVNIPSREEIESRLEDQQLDLVSRRYLRDLRSSATIETR
jgi:peptidyl-prolyl cis-trans isomerase SurA